MAYMKGLVATLAELEDFYKGQPAGDILELMNQTNDILSDVQFMESNQSDGHLTRIRTGLPEVYWRRLYRGTPPGKSQWAQVKEATGMLEARMELDIKELELYGDKARAFRLSEGKAFARGHAPRRWRPPCFTGTATSIPTSSTACPCATPLCRPRT